MLPLNYHQVHHPGSRYDRQFHKAEGYNNKLHRDDRENAKSRGLTVNDEVIFLLMCFLKLYFCYDTSI